jgi:hypothetical protein
MVVSRSKDKAVINAWRALLGDLTPGPGANADDAAIIAWNLRCGDAVVAFARSNVSGFGLFFHAGRLRRWDIRITMEQPPKVGGRA